MREVSIAEYEGLVYKTSEMFAAMVGLEREDMQQELRLKIVKAKRAFDPSRSKMSERAYVYSCVANFVKDLKKIAARRSVMRVEHIEDHRDEWAGSLSAFEFQYAHVTEDQAFTVLGRFTMPATISDDERAICALAVLGYDQQEVADLLGRPRSYITTSMRNVRDKLADWKPPAEAPIPAPAPSIAIAA